MVIYNITNFQKFFETLDGCDDNVTIVTPDGLSYDYRANRTLLHSLFGALNPAHCDRMELKLKNPSPETADRLFCYLLSKERASA